MPRILRILPLLLALPLTSGCLTTLAVSALAGSGSATDTSHMDTVKDTARNVATSARDKADELGESAQDLIDSWAGDSP